MINKVNENVTYEQPLNQRVRNFLRLEHLFGIVDYHSQQESHWDSRATISCLFEILDLVSRSDIKNDLIKELERHIVSLNALKNNSDINTQKLDSFLDRINICLNTLRDVDFKLGHQMKQHELTTLIKQRVSIPGGTCSFDLPAFHYWLNKSAKSRHEEMIVWRKDMFVIQDSLTIVLFMLRNSTVPAIESAESGFYQQAIKSKLFCQLIRVIIPDDCNCFPEISGGKHRFTIRFMEQFSATSRYMQTKKTIEFELHCCIL